MWAIFEQAPVSTPSETKTPQSLLDVFGVHPSCDYSSWRTTSAAAAASPRWIAEGSHQNISVADAQRQAISIRRSATRHRIEPSGDVTRGVTSTLEMDDSSQIRRGSIVTSSGLSVRSLPLLPDAPSQLDNSNVASVSRLNGDPATSTDHRLGVVRESAVPVLDAGPERKSLATALQTAMCVLNDDNKRRELGISADALVSRTVEDIHALRHANESHSSTFRMRGRQKDLATFMAEASISQAPQVHTHTPFHWMEAMMHHPPSSEGHAGDRLLHQITTRVHHDEQLTIEAAERLRENQQPPVVYSPFMRRAAATHRSVF